MLTLTLIINLTKIIISKMGLLRVKVMNQHPLQLCSLLLALADHAYMLVYVPVTQLWSLSVPMVSHYSISTHAEFLNNPSKQYQNSKVSQQKLFFSVATPQSLLLISMQPLTISYSTLPLLLPSAVCTAAAGWKMAWKRWLVRGCQQRHSRYMHTHL